MRKMHLISGFVIILILLSVGRIFGALEHAADEASGQARTLPPENDAKATVSKASTETTADYTGEGDGGIIGGDGSANRIGPGGPPCSKGDLVIYQEPTTPLPSGIPSYTVTIENLCYSGGNCSISNIHLSCGSFSSARLIDPAIFRRIAYDDCLVNDGQPLYVGQVVIFQYADSFEYPMSVSSVSC